MRRRDHEYIVEAYRERLEYQQRLIDTIYADLEHEARARIRLLERIAGLEPPEPYGEPIVMPTITETQQEFNRQAAAARQVPWNPLQPRGTWDVPLDPADLDAPFEDPTDLTSPLDQLPSVTDEPIPDALPPEGEQPWQPEEPVAFPEPVPEAEHRQRIVGIAPGEDPFAGLKGLERE